MHRPFKVLLCLLAMSCGVNSDKPQPNYSEFIDAVESETIEEVSKKVTLDAAMPEGLGLALTRRLKGYSACTALMISESHAITNARCVPILPKKIECKEALGFFVKTKNGQELRTCKKVITTARVKRGAFIDPDFAVIELSSPILGIPVARVSRDGIADKEELTIETVNTIVSPEGLIRAEHKRSVCVPHSDSLIGNFSDRKSTIIPLFPKEDSVVPCHAVGGNSGSPVYNAKGQVVAVVLASKADGIFVSPKNMVMTDEVADFAVATNLSCMKLGLAALDTDLDASCAQIRQDEVSFKERMLAKVNDETKRQLLAELDNSVGVIPSSFQYDLKEKDQVYSFIPRCVNAYKEWKRVDRQRVNSRGFLGKNKAYKGEVPQYQLSMQYMLDKYARLSAKPTAEKIGSSLYVIDELHTIFKEGAGKMIHRQVINEKEVDTEITIALCEVASEENSELSE
ncbi:MAG: hypothetical protein ACLGG0_11155 [Bacteriovoracia bacterium]